MPPRAAGRTSGAAALSTGRQATEGTATTSIQTEIVWRTALVNRLRAARSLPVVSIVAPPGYGKTTLLAQWSDRDGRPFVGVTLEPGLDATAVSARMEDALPTDPTAAVVAVDDIHLLTADAARVVEAIVPRLPAGSTLAVAGRRQALSGIPRLRAAGALLELGVEDLALTRRESRSLLYAAGVALSDAELDELLAITEGWPAGIRLGALSRHRLTGADAAGDDLEERALAALLRPEGIAELGPEELEFLRRTSFLDRLSGPLCDAVLERQDSARMLESLAAAGLFLFVLDRRGEWFRYHTSFAGRLRDELETLDRKLLPVLARRAADWFERNGDSERALQYASIAGDADHLAQVLARVASPLHNSGRERALAGWLSRFEDLAGLDDYPQVATLAARLHAHRGSVAEAERCLESAARGASRRRKRDAALRPRIALVRAAMCGDGLESMLAGAERVLDELPSDDRWRPFALCLQGTATVLLGETERGDAILSRSVHAAERIGATETRALALTERSILAGVRGERDEADALLCRGLETIESHSLHGYPTSALTLALSARSLLLHGRAREAATPLASARRLTPALTGSLPWLAVQTRLELARAYVTLRDGAAACRALHEAGDLLDAYPRLGVLAAERDLVVSEAEAIPGNEDGRTVGLTVAELRLLPMLATHLSFREIGLRFFLSRNTVKTQAISVYRKLGASSRSEAVMQAERLGLLDSSLDTAGLILTG
jgi:LuxR family maltose regulon positive regulatory protein